MTGRRRDGDGRPGEGVFGALLREKHPDFVARHETDVRRERSKATLKLQPTRLPAPPPPAKTKAAPTTRPSPHPAPRRLREDVLEGPYAAPRAPEIKSVRPYDGLEGEACLRAVEAALGDHRFDVADDRPAAVSSDIAAAIDARIAAGARILAEGSAPDPEGYVVGFDFGTSSSKIVVHQPFTAGDPSAALPVFEPLRSGGLEHLWQTVLWRSPIDDRFALHPIDGAAPLHGFKAGLIRGSGALRVSGGVANAYAAAAYLALMVAYVVGWVEETRPLGGRGGRAPQRVQVGCRWPHGTIPPPARPSPRR